MSIRESVQGRRAGAYAASVLAGSRRAAVSEVAMMPFARGIVIPARSGAGLPPGRAGRLLS